MTKLKTKCYQYKKYFDFYLENVNICNDRLLTLLSIYLNETILAIIDTEVDIASILPLQCNRNCAPIIMPSPQTSCILFGGNKTELIHLLNHINISNLDGLFISNASADAITEEIILSLEPSAARFVKDGFSDTTISINFQENEVIFTVDKSKCSVQLFREKLTFFIL